MVSNLWSEESTTTDYPQVIFDAVKDNPTYIELLLNSNPGSWLLGWYMEYLHTIWRLPVLGSVVAKMADFMCEELQHERFQELRPSVMVTAVRVSPGRSLRF
jgi:senataxin